MACILRWSFAVRVYDSQEYRKIDVTRERISRILKLREILLSIQTGFSLVNLHEDLLTIVKRRKLQWYGHVSRSSGMAKTIFQDTVKEGRRQGRQRNRWEHNIREWTGLEFAKSQTAVENRGKWRKLVVKSSVVPQRLSRLKDRGDDRDLGIFKVHTAVHACDCTRGL